MTGEEARLPGTARAEGYETAIFSENPTFSTRTGFGNHVDAPHDDVDRKLLASDFSLHRHVDEVSFRGALSLAGTILATPNRTRNLVNTVSAAYYRYTDRERSYPHHGERLFSHLESYLARQRQPTVVVANVLEPHNPYLDTPPAVERSRDARELSALRAGDNRRYLLTDDPPPEVVRSVYGDWDAFLDAQRRVYEEYAAESDRLLAEWRGSQPERFEDALVVVVGDHGQLFGAGGMVGHHTSLHPHGVVVPLAISPPSGWATGDRTVGRPVSLAGVGRALMDICTGAVTTTEELMESIAGYSRECDGAVVTCADGPTWSMASLYENDRYDSRLVDALAVRKVACARDDRVDVFTSPWDSGEITARSYEYTHDDRTERDGPDPQVPEAAERWLRRRYDHVDEGRDAVDARLEALGYR